MAWPGNTGLVHTVATQEFVNAVGYQCQWSGALWVSGPLATGARASPGAAASVVKVGTYVFPGLLLQANHHAFGSERVSKAMTDV